MIKIINSILILLSIAAPISAGDSSAQNSTAATKSKHQNQYTFELSFGSSLLFLEQPILKNGEIVKTDNLYPLSCFSLNGSRSIPSLSSG